MKPMISFRLILRQEKVLLEKEEHTLKELTGAERDEYLVKLSERVKIGPDGKATGVRDIRGLQSALLALCLYSPDQKKVPLATIESWPAVTVEGLFTLAQSLSGLSMDAAEAVGNG